MPLEWFEDGLPADAITRRVTQWGQTARDLKQRPKVWAKVADKPQRPGANTLKNEIEKGTRAIEFEPAGSFKAAIRPNPDGSWAVIAQFVGDDSPFAANGDSAADYDDDVAGAEAATGAEDGAEDDAV